MNNANGDHSFNVGDSAILDVTFELAEVHAGETYDDPRDVVRFVRGDMVDILDIIHCSDGRKVAVIYDINAKDATTVSTEFLKPVKGTVHTGGWIKGGIIEAGKLNPNLRLTY
ncbi:hypothetical protein BK703_16565 [Bacillus thuringiensis serovar silo]|uniref:hypothetical protein n=1 Tax=Bacillus thuringiensis TaxID=1428 RepID=UPI000A3D25BE|nr:hypothetical protein [Bacillus thuringiensis]MDA2128684.1 hypothetical protein [Bacillus cereus]MED3275372.1 hypothetical protein [Bacillus thuringiensis]OTW55253.1 hypothetical protein BK703_16565 [Bacillus thuringiensis serovar silo]OTW74315.1 hypothetical protein BK700_01480 [Bacillus thuringiensis serovar toguchini]